MRNDASGRTEGETGTVVIVHPRPAASDALRHAHGASFVRRAGNVVTAHRWSCLLRQLGWKVLRRPSWDGEPCDLLIGLHAQKSSESLERFRRHHPTRPTIVAGAGTDLYGEERDRVRVEQALRAADRIVVLQPEALRQLPNELHSRARVIFQSVRPLSIPKRDGIEPFVVLVLAHLRPIKDPLLAARAARQLGAGSRVQVRLAGGVLDPACTAELEREERENPRFRYLGELARRQVLDELARANVMVSSSHHEGGSNVLSEALASDLPVLATRIPGTLGILGADHPGLFEIGNELELARLIERAETDPAFLEKLLQAGRRRAWITAPSAELESWRTLLAELALEAPGADSR